MIFLFLLAQAKSTFHLIDFLESTFFSSKHPDFFFRADLERSTRWIFPLNRFFSTDCSFTQMALIAKSEFLLSDDHQEESILLSIKIKSF